MRTLQDLYDLWSIIPLPQLCVPLPWEERSWVMSILRSVMDILNNVLGWRRIPTNRTYWTLKHITEVHLSGENYKYFKVSFSLLNRILIEMLTRHIYWTLFDTVVWDSGLNRLFPLLDPVISSLGIKKTLQVLLSLPSLALSRSLLLFRPLSSSLPNSGILFNPHSYSYSPVNFC